MGFNLGSFMSGLSKGVDDGKKYADLINSTRQQMAINKELKAAQAASDKAASDMVQTNYKPATIDLSGGESTSPNMSMIPQNSLKNDLLGRSGNPEGKGSFNFSDVDGYSVGDSKFKTREDALKDAKTKAPSQMDMFLKNGASKIHSMYLESGNIEKATAWSDYAEKAEGRRNMKTWAEGMKSLMNGDYDDGVDKLAKLQGLDDPSIKLLGKELLKNEAGEMTGMVLNYERNGKKSQLHVTPETMLQFGATNLAPTNFFEKFWSQRQEEEKAIAEARKAKSQTDSAEKIAVVNGQARIAAAKITGGFSLAKEKDRQEHATNSLLMKDALGIGKKTGNQTPEEKKTTAKLKQLESDRDYRATLYNAIESSDMPEEQRDRWVENMVRRSRRERTKLLDLPDDPNDDPIEDDKDKNKKK